MFVQDLNKTILFSGTRQSCIHFIKSKNLKRGEFTVSASAIDVYHAVPVSVPPQKSFLKRIFTK